MMTRTTKYRRTAARARLLAFALGAAVLFGSQEYALSQETAQGDSFEPIATIRATAEGYVKSLIPPGNGENIVTVGALDGRLRLAHCPSKELTASLPAGQSLQARSLIGVTCQSPTHWTVYVPVTVDSSIDVLVLKHPVDRDARLGPTDVSIERRKTAGPGNLYLTSLPELSGRTVRRPLPSGTTLAVDMFAADLVVRRGQQITLLSSGGMIEVRAVGRAMTDGAQGARIQVQNLSSMRVIEGVVESSDLVRVAN